TVRCPAVCATSGMICTAEAPVPTIATFLPLKLTGSLGHLFDEYHSPWKVSRPGNGISRGLESRPEPLISQRHTRLSPVLVCTIHRPVASSQVPAVTRVENWMSLR